MKYSLNWLKEFVPVSWTLEEITHRLTMAGVEVEGVEVQGKGLDNVIVAQILKSEQHPNADRLSVCEVDTGSGVKQIVCGAKNYKVGDKIPLAVPGAKLPNGMEIKRSKLRGVESDGMMCSAKELALAEDSEGLLILPADLKLGTPITQALGLNDVLLELEITPNRPDLLSHWGMARELAALANLPAPDKTKLLSPADESKLSQTATSHPGISIQVDNFELCPRYTGRIIRGVKVGPSPEWLKQRLSALGQRSISNVVDITNYILLEIGQPLHAFDLSLLRGPAIIVRQARPGEKLHRLDDETSELQTHMLVIADKERPAALAGVIGGMESAVTDKTVDILLESASFQTSSVRKTSKVSGISTDSSYRFERGVDPELAGWASLRATNLILQVCGGTVDGPLVDVRGPVKPTAAISCRVDRVNSLLGIPLSENEIASTLTKLGCEVKTGNGTLSVTPPTYRRDLERQVDLIEEVSRVYGIENIPGKTSAAPLSTTRDSEAYLFARQLRSIFNGLGFDEATHYTIVSLEKSQTLGINVSETQKLANPLSSDMDTLRPSLLGGLLDATAHNLSSGIRGVSLFEIGKTFFSSADNKVLEKLSVGMVLAGIKSDGASWEAGVSGKKHDFYDLKGAVDVLLETLKLTSVSRSPDTQNHSYLQKGVGFLLIQGKEVVGYVGKINSKTTQSMKISQDVFYAEFDFEWLRSAQNRVTKYNPWTNFPAIQRDIALTLSATEQHEKVSETLQKLGRKFAEPKGIFLQKVDLFDIFQSDKMGADKKSLAYSLTYQSPDRTLTDQEVNSIHDSIKKQLKAEVVCELRE